jgi:hypothetical protein
MPQRGTPARKTQRTYNDSNDEEPMRSVSPVRRSPVRSSPRKQKTPTAPLKQNPRNKKDDVVNKRKPLPKRATSPTSPIASDEEEDMLTPPPKLQSNKRSREQYEEEDDEEMIREKARRTANSRKSLQPAQSTQILEELKQNNKIAKITYVDIEHNSHSVSSFNPTVDTIGSVAKRCEDYKPDSIIYILRETNKVLSPNTTLKVLDDQTIDAYQCKLKFIVSQNGKIIKKGIELHSNLMVSELRKCLKISDSTALYFRHDDEEFYLPPTTSLAGVFYEIWERSNKQYKVNDEIQVVIKDAQTQRISFIKGEKSIDIMVPSKITYHRLYEILSKESEEFIRGHTLYLGKKPIRDLSKMIPSSKNLENFRFVEETFDVVCTIFLPSTTPQQKPVTVSSSFTGEKLLKLVLGSDKGYNIFRTFGNKQIYNDDYLGSHLSSSICYVRIHPEKDPYQFDQHTRLDNGFCVRIAIDEADRETDNEEMNSATENDFQDDVYSSDCESHSTDDEDDVIDDEVIDQDHYIHVEIQRKLDDDYQESKFHINSTIEQVMQNIKRDFPLSEKYTHKFLLPNQVIIDPQTIDQGVPVGVYLRNNSKIIVALKDCINFKILLPNGDIFEKECNKNWTIAQMLAEKIGIKCDTIICKDVSSDTVSIISSDDKSNLVREKIKENVTLELILDD